MAMLAFSDWVPDLSSYHGSNSQVISNVVPQGDGYGPFADFSALSSALPAACRGYFYARKSDGTIVVFAGTSTRLFRLSNTDFTWIPVSKVTALTSISNATPAVFALNSHGLSVGDAIVLSTTGALPTGLTVGTVYYVITAGFGANSFEVSTTLGGSAVNTTGAGSGTHSFTAQYSALSSNAHWQFAQFNNLVLATQANVVVQVYDLSSATAFSDLGGSPPQAAYISIVGRFIVLSGLLSAAYRIQWSGLNATTTWTSGVNSSDYQDLPDGGLVRGVAGGEFGVIFQETAMRRMIFAPGNPIIFQIDRITEDKGLYAPYSIIRAADKIFFLAPQGFQVMASTGSPQPIGKDRFDKTFFADYDSGAVQLIIGAADPTATRVYWAYKSGGGPAGLFDKMLCFDYVSNRATIVSMTGEYLASLAAPGTTLDALDSVSSSIDTMTVSLDDISTSALSQLSAVSSAHKIGFFSGSSLEATMDTAEQEMEAGRRVRVKGLRPITDAPTCYGAVGARETLQSTITYSAEQAVNARGLCPANVSTRLARARLRIPAGTAWSFATGVDPDFAPEGKR